MLRHFVIALEWLMIATLVSVTSVGSVRAQITTVEVDPNECWQAGGSGPPIHIYPLSNIELALKSTFHRQGDVLTITTPDGVTRYRRVPCPPTEAQINAVEVAAFIGANAARAASTFGPFFSVTQDIGAGDNSARASATDFAAGFGGSIVIGGLPILPPPPLEFIPPPPPPLLPPPPPAPTGALRFGDNSEEAYAANFPIKAPRKQQQPRSSRVVWGVDGNVYFFAGGLATINGIPGGPFGTATGADNFTIRNNVMFTVGGFITVPITPVWAVSVTGGFAELNQTVKYNCVTFCAVAPATPAFTASQDKWVPGGYVGARLSMPISLPWIGSANIGLDYKHVFFGSYDVSLGTVPTRQVGVHVSPDMDLLTLRLAVPIR